MNESEETREGEFFYDKFQQRRARLSPGAFWWNRRLDRKNDWLKIDLRWSVNYAGKTGPQPQAVCRRYQGCGGTGHRCASRCGKWPKDVERLFQRVDGTLSADPMWWFTVRAIMPLFSDWPGGGRGRLR